MQAFFLPLRTDEVSNNFCTFINYRSQHCVLCVRVRPSQGCAGGRRLIILIILIRNRWQCQSKAKGEREKKRKILNALCMHSRPGVCEGKAIINHGITIEDREAE